MRNARISDARRRVLRAAVVFASIFFASFAETRADEGEAFFSEQVEPILRKRCYECHSHAARDMQGGLALDWRKGWETGGDRGPAIVPGDADASVLLRAVSHDDPDLQMPEEKLPDEEIALLVRWVENGAADPRSIMPEAAAVADAGDWWSLKPLVFPAVPPFAGDNPIDAFVNERLAREGISPSPEAERRDLIRRATFDLHGLPPTPEETADFLAEARPDAYERLVDRLLASPRYGERWARHWLDVVHFADTHGFEHDAFRPNAWRYRDYVIESFNRDVPWSDFVREQLAADAFYPESPELTAALGFLGAGPYDHSAAVTAPMSFENLDRDDLVTQTMGAFVSVTANCARCHAHKFDPISQEDYYALQAVFAGVAKGDVEFDDDPAVAETRRRWTALKLAAENRDAATLLSEENRSLVAEWEATRGAAPVWKPLQVETYVSAGGAELKRLDDGSILSSGVRPEVDAVVVTGTSDLTRITAVRLDVLDDESLPMKGPGRMDNGNLHLSEFELRSFASGGAGGQTVKIKRASADFDQIGWTSQLAIDGDLKTAWGIHPAVGVSHYAVFELGTPLAIQPGSKVALTLKQLHGGGHLIGRFAVTVTDAEDLSLSALPIDAEAAAAKGVADRSDEEQATLAAAVLKVRAERELAALPPRAKVYAAGAAVENERGVVRLAEPKSIRVLSRGDLDKPGDAVGPGALSAVTAIPARFDDAAASASESHRRAALADWIVHPENPLSWRSVANRVWGFHFGRGLSDTPSDFGRMGSQPIHPELLDWLACELRDGDGTLKPLHRAICLSAAYRRSSANREDLAAHDPDNRLLARGSRRRLDAEGFRDAVMATSGRLDLTMGGPGVQHFSTSPGPQMTPKVDYDGFGWDSPGATRRSVYRVVWRGIPDPLMDALDFPDLGLPAPTRNFSASPLQSLALVNDRFVLHHAKTMAEHVRLDREAVADQVREVVCRTWLREPTDEEAAPLTALANEHGLEAVCRLLFNSDEFLFLD